MADPGKEHMLISMQEVFSFFPEALLAGTMIAAVCAFLGTFVVLKRLVFIGATLSEAATCGIAAAFFFGWNPFWGTVLLTTGVVSALALVPEEKRIPRDALLAFIFVLCANLSIVFVSKSAAGLDEVKSLLYGDLIVTTPQDLKILALILVPAGLLLMLFIRPVIYTFVDRDTAKILGIKVRFWELFFFYILGLAVSAAAKLGGMLLVFCHLVVPPMLGLMLFNRMTPAITASMAAAVLSNILGFWTAYAFDLPVNQVISLTNCLLLGFAFLWKFIGSIRTQK